MLTNYKESLKICNVILETYPNNADVLFDKATNLIMLNKTSECLDSLNSAINTSKKFKIKAKKNILFKLLENNQRFAKLIE
jgi:tetratricopeptide (TPR) repeat protein